MWGLPREGAGGWGRGGEAGGAFPRVVILAFPESKKDRAIGRGGGSQRPFGVRVGAVPLPAVAELGRAPSLDLHGSYSWRAQSSPWEMSRPSRALMKHID